MSLLAIYILDAQQRRNLRLVNIETAEIVHVITAADAGVRSLLNTAKDWAEDHGHKITDLDAQVLR